MDILMMPDGSADYNDQQVIMLSFHRSLGCGF